MKNKIFIGFLLIRSIEAILTLCDRNNPCVEKAKCIIDPAAPILGKPFCLCPEGYNGDGKFEGTGCFDVNECEAMPNPCDRETQTCKNTEGSYECSCKEGYRFNKSIDSCEDINECLNSTICGTSQAICINIPGSYLCKCLDDKKIFENNVCIKKNSCFSNNQTENPCDRINGFCKDFDSIPHCFCKPGFKWDNNKRLCVDIDECAEFSDGCPTVSKCLNTEGSYKCLCNELEGWENIDDFTCGDLNECIKFPDICGEKAVCCMNLTPPKKFLCTNLVEKEKSTNFTFESLSNPFRIFTNAKNVLKNLNLLQFDNEDDHSSTNNRALENSDSNLLKRTVETAGKIIPKIVKLNSEGECPTNFIDLREVQQQKILNFIPEEAVEFFSLIEELIPLNITSLSAIDPKAIIEGLTLNAKSLIDNANSWQGAASELPKIANNAASNLTDSINLKENVDDILVLMNKAAVPMQNIFDVAKTLKNSRT